MKTLRLACALLCLALSTYAFADAPKTYQVTGEVIDVGDDTVTVQKGKEKFEMAKNADTKTEGELKKGAKVMVEYRMTAATITVKEAKKK